MTNNWRNVNTSSPLSIVLEHHTCQEAERILKEYDVVLFTLGARTKEKRKKLTEAIIEEIVNQVKKLIKL